MSHPRPTEDGPLAALLDTTARCPCGSNEDVTICERHPCNRPPDYFAAPGLSNSGMSDLAVSPLRYWYNHVRLDREPEEPTPQMAFGTALHCAVLEPDQFEKRYARELDLADYPGVLRTMEDLRGHLTGMGVKPKGTRKADVIAQVLEYCPDYPIWDVLERDHALEHEGKEILSADFWCRVNRCTEALRLEPALERILSDPNGHAEQPVFVTDPDINVNLKAKMDWTTPTCTFDVKTFSQKRGKSIDKSVADAIWYEQYYRQAWLYSHIRALVMGGGFGGAQNAPEFVMAFVESDPPHEVRIKALRPKCGGQVNLYWERARVECCHLMNLYADCIREFGEQPWRTTQDVTPLYDEDLPGMAFS